MKTPNNKSNQPLSIIKINHYNSGSETLTIFNGWIIRFHKLIFNKLNCNRRLSCERGDVLSSNETISQLITYIVINFC